MMNPKGSTSPSAADWQRLRLIDTERLDLSDAREEALEGLVRPAVVVILLATFAVGALLALVGLDVAPLLGGSSFGLFLLQAAYNGVVVLILSFPLLLVALKSPDVLQSRQELVDWFIAEEARAAREYLEDVESPDGLLHRFEEDLVEEAHFGKQGPGIEDVRSLVTTSREGDVRSIRLDAYRKATAFLQRKMDVEGVSAAGSYRKGEEAAVGSAK